MVGRIPGRVWSLILAAVALVRAGSYVTRPPLETTASTLVEGALPYTVWAVVLAAAAATIITGITLHNDWCSFLGHLALIFCYSTFAASIGLAALVFDQPWAGIGILVLAALLSTERLFVIGNALGRK